MDLFPSEKELQLLDVCPDTFSFVYKTGKMPTRMVGMNGEENPGSQKAILEIFFSVWDKTDYMKVLDYSIWLSYRPVRKLKDKYLTKYKDKDEKMEVEVFRNRFPHWADNSCFCDTVFSACFVVSDKYKKRYMDKDTESPWDTNYETLTDKGINLDRMFFEKIGTYPQDINKERRGNLSEFIGDSYTSDARKEYLENLRSDARQKIKSFESEEYETGDPMDIYDYIIDSFNNHFLKLHKEVITFTETTRDVKIIYEIVNHIEIDQKTVDMENEFKKNTRFNIEHNSSQRYVYIPPAFCVRRHVVYSDLSPIVLKFDYSNRVILSHRSDKYILRSVVVNSQSGDHFALFFYLNKKWYYYNAVFKELIFKEVNSDEIVDKFPNRKDFKDVISFHGHLFFFELYESLNKNE